MNSLLKACGLLCLLTLFSTQLLIPALHADNKVLGQIELVGASKVENTSGVWIDGQYVGYLNELKGSTKFLLIPGEHSINERQGGALSLQQKVS